MRLVFLGTPGFALPTLGTLQSVGHEIALVVTQPDRPVGRGQRMAHPPVAQHAVDVGLPLWQTENLRGEEAEQRLRAVGADAMVLVAFGAIVPPAVLALAPFGILNLHPSLLPRWRGASPMQSALLAGDEETGVSIIRLVREMDAGPILAQERVAITPADDYLTLEEKLSSLGADLVVRTLEGLRLDAITPAPQDEELATLCKKIERADAWIDWTLPAHRVWGMVRAYRGWPQAFTTWEGGLLKIARATPLPSTSEASPGTTLALPGEALGVQTGEGVLRLDVVTPEGSKPQAGPDFLRGHRPIVGARMG